MEDPEEEEEEGLTERWRRSDFLDLDLDFFFLCLDLDLDFDFSSSLTAMTSMISGSEWRGKGWWCMCGG